MSKKFQLKNHVAPKAKRLGRLLQSKYEFNLSDLNEALKGDKTKLQQIGETARQAKQIQEFMPLLQEAYLSIIKGTEAYNLGVAEILSQGASSAVNIDKAQAKVTLAQRKYGHQRKELAAEFVAAKDAEALRHEQAMNYIQLKAYIDAYISTVDGEARLVEQTNRPEWKQLDENLRYQNVEAKHLLQYGDASRIDLLPRRDYVNSQESNPPQPRQSARGSLSQTITSIRESLGF